MDQCPICEKSLRDALVICGYCGEELPLRVVVVSEGSRGDGGFAVVEEQEGAEGGAGRQGSKK
jgi:hypothetical protein